MRASLTADELEELRAGRGVADFAPAGALPVSDLVAGDLSVLATEGGRLPAEHDALQRLAVGGAVGAQGQKQEEEEEEEERCVTALRPGVYV